MRIVDKAPQFISQATKLFDQALDRMANDIVLVTKIKIPFKTGNLQNKIEKKTNGLLKKQVWVNETYAAYQERGARFDGTRRVINYTTPGTDKAFLKDAAGSIKKDGLNYIKQAANSIHV